MRRGWIPLNGKGKGASPRPLGRTEKSARADLPQKRGNSEGAKGWENRSGFSLGRKDKSWRHKSETDALKPTGTTPTLVS